MVGHVSEPSSRERGTSDLLLLEKLHNETERFCFDQEKRFEEFRTFMEELLWDVQKAQRFDADEAHKHTPRYDEAFGISDEPLFMTGDDDSFDPGRHRPLGD